MSDGRAIEPSNGVTAAELGLHSRDLSLFAADVRLSPQRATITVRPEGLGQGGRGKCHTSKRGWPLATHACGGRATVPSLSAPLSRSNPPPPSCPLSPSNPPPPHPKVRGDRILFRTEAIKAIIQRDQTVLIKNRWDAWCTCGVRRVADAVRDVG